MPEMSVETLFEGPKVGTSADLVLIHGLNGHCRDTWTHQNGTFWPAWVSERHPDWRILSVAHSSEITKWFFSTSANLDLINRAHLVLEVLKTYDIGVRPFAVITHSLGGLIAKAILRRASDNGTVHDRQLLENAKLVGFLATPHRGAGLANALALIPGITSNIISDLRAGGSYLDDLSDWYARAAERHKIQTLCFKETIAYRGKIIVNKDSAHAHTPDGSPIPIEANHMGVCKFEHLNSPGYRIVRGALDEALSSVLIHITDREEKLGEGIARPTPADYEKHRVTYFMARPNVEKRAGVDEGIDLSMEEISQIPSSDGVRQKFRTLVQQAFSHHSRDTLGSGSFVSIKAANGRAEASIPDEKVSAMFHNEYMVQCKIAQSRLNGKELSFADFADRISKPLYEMDEESGLARNELLILEGPVGTGKTTVLSHLMYQYSDLFVERKIIPVRFDFELIDSGQVMDVARFLNGLITILGDAALHFSRISQAGNEFRELERLIRSDALRVRPTEATLNNLEEIKSALSEYLISTRKMLGVEFLLIFDNLDAQYHLYDRHLFTVAGEQIRAAAVDALRTLFDSFENTRSQPLGNRGVRLLYVLRPNTRHYFVTAKIRTPFMRGATDVFTLVSASLSSIVHERLRLLGKLCSIQKDGMKPSDYQLLGRFVDKLVAAESKIQRVREGQTDQASKQDLRIAMIEKISNQGLRRSVDHLSKYIWLDEEDGSELTERFSAQYSPQILAFILGDRCRYHQFRSNFPNLFLTRGEVVGHISEYGQYDDTVRLHPQTYWLKYLVAWYINNQPEVRPDEVFSVFHDGGAGYPKGVVGFCMASLAHVDSTNMVMATFKPAVSSRGLTVDTLKMTPRGEIIFASFMWSFIYLQLVVEDPNLLIPRCLSDEFSYVPGLHYGYLVADSKEYGDRTAQMVRHKARQVLFFLELLEGSLKAEKIRYPRMFQHLENVGFAPPNFVQIRDQLESDVTHILGKHRKSSQREDLVQELGGLRHSVSTRMSAVRKQLADIYTEVW